jgi:hypothetical protein
VRMVRDRRLHRRISTASQEVGDNRESVEHGTTDVREALEVCKAQAASGMQVGETADISARDLQRVEPLASKNIVADGSGVLGDRQRSAEDAWRRTRTGNLQATVAIGRFRKCTIERCW